ncbi:Sugar-specific transcriptional regulator TrmB [Caloranaerobacter azorensis DSM 13643]|uniref:Sugar-specific transcriptional regulator TrmB n=1 Tax=Caloranaerobacter azorensis DSM 13643 TaxID=1121264 RepID=A0A1M5RE18_9FIRM|nr:helix-turn-helix domain-containing protein [Caloranaerobacter azorensis]SHH24511.1 Sugar-specific transcriptional regulator TrmB [Caloranaerobacter azorensis DSM 13643]
MDKEKIIEKLMEIGINKYEAKAYIALLNKPDITAYELSKLSGVPQAKIYETMSKLLDKNLVNIISDNPIKYVAVDLEGFLDSYKRKVNSTVKYLKNSLKKMDSKNKISYMLHLEGIENIKNKIKRVLAKTNEFLYLEIWNVDYEYFKDELKLLEQRGVEIVTVLYGNVSEEIGEIYYHEMEEMESYALKHGRWFTLVSDGEESLFAMFNEDKSQAIWTANKAFMLMAESFIVHDIYLAEIYKEYREELDKKFGPNLKRIRQKMHI